MEVVPKVARPPAPLPLFPCKCRPPARSVCSLRLLHQHAATEPGSAPCKSASLRSWRLSVCHLDEREHGHGHLSVTWKSVSMATGTEPKRAGSLVPKKMTAMMAKR